MGRTRLARWAALACTAMAAAAGQDGDRFQVWSIDLSTGARQLEIERTIVGESEGLDEADALGGLLHWQIQPYNAEGVPTYPPLNGTLLHFVPAAGP